MNDVNDQTQTAMQRRREIEAIAAISAALDGLDNDDARGRVVRWAMDAYGIQDASARREIVNAPPSISAIRKTEREDFSTIGDLFEATNPTSTRERVLAACYWQQELQGETEFGSQAVNNELKQMGYAVPNITSTLGRLIKSNPQLIRQIRKSGKTQQARKKYVMTEAGKNTVRAMMSGAHLEGD